MSKKNNLLKIFLLSFFYLNIIVCLILTFSTWSSYLDNGEIIMAVLLLFTIVFSFYLSYYILDVILHELGHLFIGYLCDWKIYSFNILGFSVEKRNNKFMVSRVPINGLAGYVEMNPKSEKQNIVLPMLGGIIVNLFLSMIFIIVTMISKNPFIICLSFSVFSSNLLSAVTNSIPFTPTAITKTDMYQILEIKDSIENNNFKYYQKYTELYNAYKKKQIKDIEDNYFLLDTEAKSTYVTMLHLAYIDKLIALGKFSDALERINKTIDSNEVDENSKVIITFEKLFCMVMCNLPKNEVTKIYNSPEIKDNEKNLEYEMAVELYAYHKIISKTLSKEEYYKKIINRKINTTSNKYEKQSLIELLSYIDDY